MGLEPLRSRCFSHLLVTVALKQIFMLLTNKLQKLPLYDKPQQAGGTQMRSKEAHCRTKLLSSNLLQRRKLKRRQRTLKAICGGRS